MSIDHVRVYIETEPRVVLRTIDESDLDKLRQWKNQHRLRFFFQDEISAEQQRQWFENMRLRKDDFMMIVEADGEPVGCMGYRVVDDAIDVYNVIRGNPGGPLGTMQTALAALIAHAQAQYAQQRVSVQVLADNPATQWYITCGFEEVWRNSEYVVMEWKN